MDLPVIERAEIRAVTLPLAAPRAISRETRTHAQLIEVTLAGCGLEGRGQACPMPRYGESVPGVLKQFDRYRPALGSRADVLEGMPPGAMRNAVDCALWDLECQQSGRRAEAIAGLAPRPITTAYTIPLLPPEEAGAVAERERGRPLIKVKLGHYEDDAARLRAVRAAAPGATLIVDANEGWSFAELQAIAPLLADLGVALIEQPLPAHEDAVLQHFDSPIPLCADESCHTRHSLDEVAQRYAMINIKLDKSGGLTEALALAEAAAERGLGLMVGCTSASTLAIAPAYLVAQYCAYADLDAPLFLAERESAEIQYDGSSVSFSATRRWGDGGLAAAA